MRHLGKGDSSLNQKTRIQNFLFQEFFEVRKIFDEEGQINSNDIFVGTPR